MLNFLSRLVRKPPEAKDSRARGAVALYVAGRPVWTPRDYAAVARAREIHALMKEGAVDGLSIGFRVERARHDRVAGLRRLERLDLWEISVVTFPMMPGARVSGVKRRTEENLAAAICRATRRLFRVERRGRQPRTAGGR
jgi:phage head maturation protease